MPENFRWSKADIRELTDEEYSKWYALMSDEKKARVDRFYFDEDKKRTVAGEMLARKAVAQWCSVAPEDIVFIIGENGKPYAGNLDAEFNISHSDDFVVCVIDSCQVGIDIEKIRPVDLKTVRHFCTESEIEYIFGHSPAADEFVMTTDEGILHRFFELWTRKEAYCKYLGEGLTHLLDDTSDCQIITEDMQGYIISFCKGEK
ncbi:MAG: 4'-phosphopantetheinyl transferase superfamily protein [Clostridia bacterium]|nr:4'-phosphopantetheinyl transferase superfamily protein [Clostridia bacterium]